MLTFRAGDLTVRADLARDPRDTARRCARWAGGDAYRGPLEVREDEVPADLRARLAGKSPRPAHA